MSKNDTKDCTLDNASNKKISIDLLDDLQLATGHIKTLWSVIADNDGDLTNRVYTLLHCVKQQTELIDRELERAAVITKSVAMKKKLE